MIIAHLESIAAVAVERALGCTMGGVAVAIFAEMLLRLSPRHNARTRFVIWFVALLGISFLPMSGAFLLTQHAQVVRSMQPRFTLPLSWAVYVFLAWALVASMALLRVGVGLLQLWKLRKRSVEITIDPQLHERLQERCSGRKLVVYQSSDVRIPMAVGFLRPAIILPSWTLESLSSAELTAVLLHEAAHIQRWDDWTNLVQKILGAVLFFHPAVWWIEKRLALEREMACDDLVLNHNSDPRDYARCLVSLAEKSSARSSIRLAQAAVMRVRDIGRRVSQILDVNRSSRTTIRKPVLAMVSIFSMLSFFVTAHIPQLIFFDSPATTLSIAAPQLSSSASAMVRSSDVQSKPASTSLMRNASFRSSTPVSKALKKPLASPRTVLQARSERKVPVHSPVRLVQAHAASQVRNSSQAYFLVIRTNYVESGEMFWSIGVLQLTVFHPTVAQDRPPSSQKI
jgi:beta-lactamase regulating signal transducer with metallopeptidase domain